MQQKKSLRTWASFLQRKQVWYRCALVMVVGKGFSASCTPMRQRCIFPTSSRQHRPPSQSNKIQKMRTPCLVISTYIAIDSHKSRLSIGSSHFAARNPLGVRVKHPPVGVRDLGRHTSSPDHTCVQWGRYIERPGFCGEAIFWTKYLLEYSEIWRSWLLFWFSRS